MIQVLQNMQYRGMRKHHPPQWGFGLTVDISNQHTFCSHILLTLPFTTIIISSNDKQ